MSTLVVVNTVNRDLRLDNFSIATSVQLMTDADLARFLSKQWELMHDITEDDSKKKAFLLRAQAFKARARELETGILQEVL